MLLSRSESVVKRGKNQKIRNRFKGKKKHKRLDAICEKAYNRSHRGVQKVESSDINNRDIDLELRRSNRARRAPVLLDSSPLPPKKRQKVDRNAPSGVEKFGRGSRVQCETTCSSSRDVDGQNGVWRSRLRSRGKNAAGFSDRERGESSRKGKRKLFDDSDGYRDDVDPQCYGKNESLVGDKSTVVKSKRPGRIKASNILANENLVIGLGGGVEDGKERSRDEVLELTDEVDGLHLETNLEYGREIGEDVCVASQLGEREEIAVQKDSELDKCQSNDNAEAKKENNGLEKLACKLVPDQMTAAKVDCAINDDQATDEHSQKPHEDETSEKSKGNYNALSVPDRKPRIKLGRRCGLCGGGTDGKPPKILVLEGAGSDNEAYSGSSASEEPNYDVLDGFGDQSGWLGRLLGPINDRFGIAGIWVHQQCAVWSPEVYFAGLGCLKNVRAALYRGRVLKCSRCRRPGATIGCRVDRCPKTYHLPCARAKGCIFDHRKFLIVCTDHRHLFQPHGMQNEQRLKKMKAKKLKLELRKMANDASRKDIEAEEKWLENCGEDEEFLKRESKRLHRDLWRIAPTYIGGANSEHETQFQGWESVAGLQDVIQCMKEVVILPLLYPEFFNNLGITPPRGVLLHGYPGTGKTLVVRALVGSCARGERRIAYFARKGADCLGKYVGDAERQLRLLFQVAEKSQPSIIFFDEIDGLAPCRTKKQDQTHNSVVSTLLALMDGLKSRGSVIVIGATNRPDAVDPALRRPGRFDREIYFPLPSVKDREAILSLHTQKWPKPISGPLLKWVAKQTVGFAGADLQALCTQAAIIALRRSFPLHEVLLAAETRAAKSKCPAIPSFSVEERDWLKALSCASPPCSRRENGIALNDVVCSPLKVHLVPCLLQPLTRLLVCLYMDEHVWLPPRLEKASTLVKDVITSALGRRRVQSDNWWLHIDGLLEEVDVRNEIEKNLLLANVLVGESNVFDSDATDKNTDGDFSKIIPSSSQSMGARPGLLKKMSCGLSSKSGFQVLICGYPRSGQQHLASCLLHFFVGNIDVWKVDLASVAHEGHGDMVHGLTRILMGCTGTNLCMLFMPSIDLWAVETYDNASEDCEPSSVNLQSSRKISCEGHCEADLEHDIGCFADGEATQTETAVKKVSYLWTSFVEQVESIRVNTSLIILATSELPFSLLPHRIRQFFGNEMVNCGSSLLDRKVPQFYLQLDRKMDHDKAINYFAAKLSKDLSQHFVQSLHCGNHVHENSFEEKAYETVEDDIDGVCRGKSVLSSPFNPVGYTNKSLKGKSSLLLAISTVGYQILCYPHFAELCWVTSKLKEGPCADISGSWKGWPFNSCIVRPSNSTEKVAAASGSGNIKHRESGLVRGLVAVGLSAFRGEYTSLREVCSEIRKVLEVLVGRIDEKIQAGKDKSRFICLLSQVAYLDDMVISWAHMLQSLEVDTRISEANPNSYAGPVDNHQCKANMAVSDGHKPDLLDVNLHQSKVLETSFQEVDAKGAGCSDPTDGDNGCLGVGDGVPVALEEPSHHVVLDDSVSLEHTIAPNEVILECPKAKTGRNHAELGHSESVKLPNGFAGRSSNVNADCPCRSGDKHVIELSSSAEVSDQPNGLSSSDNNVLSKATSERSGGGSDLDVNNGLKPGGLAGGSAAICFYQCCSECFLNLHNVLLRSIKIKWGLKRSDSTVEDIHDFVASLSAKLHLSLCKLFQGGTHCDHRKYCNCGKLKGTCTHECKNSDKLMMTECGCHATTRKKTSKEGDFFQISQGLHSRFVFKDGVLSSSSLETGTHVSYHCKFEKLCLSSLIGWLVMSKEVFD